MMVNLFRKAPLFQACKVVKIRRVEFFFKREECNGQDAPNLRHIYRLKGLRARKPISLVYQFAIARSCA